MTKPDNWESVQPENGDYEKLPAGGYVCKIIAVQATRSQAGNEMLKIYLDIAEGNYAGRFMKQYKTRKEYEEQPKWPNAAIFNQLTGGNFVGRFKGLIQTLEKTNPGFKWDWDEKKLEGLRCGAMFGEEEWCNRNTGEIRTTTKIRYICPIEGLVDRDIPELKKLKQTATNTTVDEDIPF